MSLLCPLCNRELPKSEESKHHLIPKMKGGARGPILIIHRICHQKIHSTITEAQCASVYNTIEALRDHEDIKIFIQWVANKPPNYYNSSKNSNKKR